MGNFFKYLFLVSKCFIFTPSQTDLVSIDCVVPHAYIVVRQINRGGRDNIYVLIIIFIISHFLHLIDGMVLVNAKANDHRVSDKINNLIVSEMKKIIKNVTDGTSN